MKFVIAITTAAVMWAMVPAVSFAQSGYNQRAHNNAAAAQKSQQQYNSYQRRR